MSGVRGKCPRLLLIHSALIGSRLSYFGHVAEQKGRKPEEKEYIPVSEIFARTLDALSGRKNINWDDEEKEVLVMSWSNMKAWDDTAQGLAKLRRKYIVYVPVNSAVIDIPTYVYLSCTLTNGATRTTIDMVWFMFKRGLHDLV